MKYVQLCMIIILFDSLQNQHRLFNVDADVISVTPCAECFNCTTFNECNYTQWIYFSGAPALTFIYLHKLQTLTTNSCLLECQNNLQCYSFTTKP
ncbi:unnamed protein product, partial [Schistosoma turkestanicum]